MRRLGDSSRVRAAQMFLDLQLFPTRKENKVKLELSMCVCVCERGRTAALSSNSGHLKDRESSVSTALTHKRLMQ